MEEYIALYKSLDRDLLSMNRQCAQELERTQQELMELLGGFELPPPSLPTPVFLVFLIFFVYLQAFLFEQIAFQHF